MDKMRLVDANAIKYREKDEYCGNGNSRPVRYVFDEDIAKLPTVDAVEVVRCRHCQYAKPYERIDGQTGYYCQNPKSIFLYGSSWERIFEPVREADDFCSYGERKDK